MEKAVSAPGHPKARSAGLSTQCAGCGADVTVRVRDRVAEAADGRSREITYADPDIVVWDCPACAQANADELTAG